MTLGTAAIAATDGSRRWLWPWDAYVAVSVAALIALVASGSETTSTRQGLSIACLALIGLSWAVIGRRFARADDDADSPDRPAALAYVAGVVVVFGVCVASDGISSFALFAVCPIAFLCLRLRSAFVAIAVLNLAPIPINGLREASLDAARDTIGIAVLGLTFTALIGASIVNVGRQSAERARLIAELEASRAEVAALSHQAGVAAERTRLAADIHDTLAQGFTSIVTLVQAAETELDTDRGSADRRLALAVRTARENLAEARAMVTVLAPAELGTGTLVEVIEKQVARLGEETGVDATCAVDVPPVLPTRVEVVLVRTVQEALTNVRKHAGAATVTVDLITHDGAVTLTVDDDGAGFDAGAARSGYGLSGMRSRVEQLGGTLTIRSAPGAGTTVTCEVPR
ncbi:sensor histidine kinase [Cryptosporangium arvum]|uniref:Oxygen sensor histidine kinase NreB n=1 Tax=Cryptosporangium arvum DSM 44712 TaxID=927661 RepID=A0A010ZWY4_9ACTN|nr:sensor histidine kinase [Cryptosporangium arvum]EXG81727.1 signal transduction histidine kinase [Cryptosporangium arvum DSM 44712]